MQINISSHNFREQRLLSFNGSPEGGPGDADSNEAKNNNQSEVAATSDPAMQKKKETADAERKAREQQSSSSETAYIDALANQIDAIDEPDGKKNGTDRKNESTESADIPKELTDRIGVKEIEAKAYYEGSAASLDSPQKLLLCNVGLNYLTPREKYLLSAKVMLMDQEMERALKLGTHPANFAENVVFSSFGNVDGVSAKTDAILQKCKESVGEKFLPSELAEVKQAWIKMEKATGDYLKSNPDMKRKLDQEWSQFSEEIRRSSQTIDRVPDSKRATGYREVDLRGNSVNTLPDLSKKVGTDMGLSIECDKSKQPLISLKIQSAKKEKPLTDDQIKFLEDLASKTIDKTKGVSVEKQKKAGVNSLIIKDADPLELQAFLNKINKKDVEAKAGKKIV